MSTFLVLQQELGDRLNLDQTVSAQATRLKRWLNLAQQDIASRRDWKFLKDRQIIQTVVDKTAGTVTVTNASATITGSSTAFASTDIRSFIQINDLNNWYEITAVASATSLTISPAFGGTTTAGATYTIRRVFYPLTADVYRVIDVRQPKTPIKLASLGESTLDLYRPDITYTGPPRAYNLFRLDPSIAVTAAKKMQMSFYPIPDDVYNIEIRYYKTLSDLSADTDLSDIPVQWHNVIIDGAEYLGVKYLKNPDEARIKQQYEFNLQKMIEEENANDDWHPVVQSYDEGRSSRFVPFPQTFNQPE